MDANSETGGFRLESLEHGLLGTRVHPDQHPVRRHLLRKKGPEPSSHDYRKSNCPTYEERSYSIARNTNYSTNYTPARSENQRLIEGYCVDCLAMREYPSWHVRLPLELPDHLVNLLLLALQNGSVGLTASQRRTIHKTISLIACAGLPATTVLGATSRATTAPAPTTAFSPTVTPARMIAFAPIQQPFLSTTGRNSS